MLCMHQEVHGREQYLMMYESIWVIVTALSRDHCIQLVHHGQQQLELVSWLLQMHKHKVAQNNFANLHHTQKTKLGTRNLSQDFAQGTQTHNKQAVYATDGVVMLVKLPQNHTEDGKKTQLKSVV